MSPNDATPVELDGHDTDKGFRKVGPVAAMKIDGESLQANMSAMATVNTGSLSATGSAIGAASVDGDATITASMVPALITRGDTTVQQSYASAVIVGRGALTKVHQSATPMIIGRSMDVTQSAAVAIVTGEADVKSSWVGIIVAPNVKVSDDSKVLISTRGAIIIGAFLLGGLGLVALAFSLGVRRVTHWRPMGRRPSHPAKATGRAALASLAALTPQIQHALKSMPDFGDLPPQIQHAIKSMPDLGDLKDKWIRR
jgi:hypothetical protein